MKTMCLQTNKYHGLLDKINDLINQERVLELLRDKYAQSDGLVGQKIQYDTWVSELNDLLRHGITSYLVFFWYVIELL